MPAPAAPTRCGTRRIARRISRGRGARSMACTTVPDGIKGTADDIDAILFSANSGAGIPRRRAIRASRARGVRATCPPIDEPVSVGRDVLRSSVLRAEADRARVRVRTSDEASRATGERSGIADRRRASLARATVTLRFARGAKTAASSPASNPLGADLGPGDRRFLSGCARRVPRRATRSSAPTTGGGSARLVGSHTGRLGEAPDGASAGHAIAGAGRNLQDASRPAGSFAHAGGMDRG